MRLRHRPTDRRAATTVEAAFVMILVFLFVFGVIEYGRLLWFYNIAYAAAREGARYASVHTGDSTTTSQVQSVVTSTMGGAQNQLSNYTVNVFYIDPTTNAAYSSTSWTDAPFTGAVAVQITGTYRFFLPGLMQMSTAVKTNGLSVDVKCIVNSEAN
jgi:Flp pilus assembly protein TadG